MADGSIKIDTKIDKGNLDKQLADVSSNLKKGITGAVKVAKMAMVGFTVAVGTAILAVKNFASTTDDIDKLSQRLGLTRQGFQELDFVLSQAGTSVMEMQTGMRTLADRMQEAVDGSGEGAKAFSRLGLSVVDSAGHMKSQEEMFKETISAMQGMSAGAEKTALANDLFGRSGQALLPLLNSQAGTMEELTARAHELGLVLGDDAINAGVALTDMLDQMQRSIKAMINKSIAPFIPAITEVIGNFTNWIATSEGLHDAINGLFNIVAGLIKIIWPLVSAIGSVIGGLLKWATDSKVLESALNSLSYVLAGLTAGVVAFMVIFKTTLVVVSLTAIMVKLKAVLLGVAGAFKVLTVAIASNPIGAIAVIITAVLIPAIIYLIRNWDKVVIVISTTVEKLKVRLEVLATVVGAGLTSAAYTAQVAFLKLGSSIVSGVMSPLRKLYDSLGMLPGAMGDNYKLASEVLGSTANILDMTAKIAEITAERVRQAGEKKVGAVKNQANVEIANIERVSKARLDALKKTEDENKNIATDPAMLIPNSTVRGAGDRAEKVGESIPEKIAKGVGNRLHVATAEADNVIINMAQAMQSTWNVLSEGLTASFSPLFGVMTKLMNGIGNIFLSAFDAIYFDKIKTLLKPLTDYLAGVFDFLPEGAIANTVSVLSTIGKFVNAGINLFSEMVQGIFDVLDTLATFDPTEIMDKLTTWLNGVTQFFDQELGTMSVFFDQGMVAIENFVNGMVQNLPALAETLTNVLEHAISNLAKKAPALAKNFMTVMLTFVEKMIEQLPAMIDAFLKVLTGMLEAIGDKAEALTIAIMQAIVGAIESIIDNLPEILKAVVKIFEGVVKGIVQELPALLTAIVKGLTGLITAIVGMIPDVINALVEIIPLAVASILEELPNLVEAILLAVPEIIIGLVKALPAIASAMVRLLPLVMVEMIKALPELAKGLVLAVVELAKALILEVPKELFTALFDAGKEIGKAVVDGVNGLKSAWEFTKAYWLDLPNKIKGIKTAMQSAGSYITQGFIDGIIYFGDLWARVKASFQRFIDGFKSFFGIASPSVLFSGFGGMIMQGLVNGINGFGKLWDFVKNVFISFINSIKNLFGTAHSIGKSLAESISKGIIAGKNFFTTAGNALKSAISTALSGGYAIGYNFMDAIKKGMEAVKIGGEFLIDIIQDAGKAIGDVVGDVADWASDNLDPRKWFAKGTNNYPGGWGVVGEEGPELVNLPKGSKIIPHKKSMAMLNGSGLQSVMNGISGVVPTPTPTPIGQSLAVTLHNVMTGIMTVDGREIGRIAFENLDRNARGAYGF